MKPNNSTEQQRLGRVPASEYKLSKGNTFYINVVRTSEQKISSVLVDKRAVLHNPTLAKIQKPKAALTPSKYSLKTAATVHSKDKNFQVTKFNELIDFHKGGLQTPSVPKPIPQTITAPVKPQGMVNIIGKDSVARFDNIMENFGILSKAGCTADKCTKANQDIGFYTKNYFQIKNLHLFGVLDGHGDAGQIMAEDIKKSLHQNFTSFEEQHSKLKKGSLFLQDKEARKNLACRVFERTQEEVVINNKSDANLSGSTVSLIFLFGKLLFCANVGDSRVILCSEVKEKSWTTTMLTKEHKPDAVEESKRITKAGGKVDQYRGK